MTPEGFVLAYHGCDVGVGEEVLAGKNHVRPSTKNTIGLVAGLISGKIAQSELFNGRNFSRLIPKLPAVEWMSLLSSEPLLSQGVTLI
jgi:hypothetical protein